MLRPSNRSIHRSLIGVYLHIPEHERIVAKPQRLAAGSGYIAENDFLSFYIWKLLLVGIAGHLWIEVGENSRAPVILRMIGVVDPDVFNGDAFRHITGIAKIVLTGIRSAYQDGTGVFAV